MCLLQYITGILLTEKIKQLFGMNTTTPPIRGTTAEERNMATHKEKHGRDVQKKTWKGPYRVPIPMLQKIGTLPKSPGPRARPQWSPLGPGQGPGERAGEGRGAPAEALARAQGSGTIGPWPLGLGS